MSIPYYKGLLFVLCFWGAKEGALKCTQGFTLTSVCRYGLESSLDRKEEPPIHLLHQPYHFLGKGGQCYVFLSQDQQTVIKFFKQRHSLPDSWLSRFDLFFPSLKKWRTHLVPKKEERFPPIFQGCLLAYERFKRESGLVYLHLYPTSLQLPFLQIVDKLGITHLIDLNSTPFLLQKKALPLFPYLEKERRKGNFGRIKQMMQQILIHLTLRCEQGIFDRDRALGRNLGLLPDGSLISLDVGSFVDNSSLKTSEHARQEIELKMQKLNSWVEEHCPSLCGEN